MFLDTREEIAKNSKIDGLITPKYDGLSISNIGSFILDNFNVQNQTTKLKIAQNLNLERKIKVVLLLIDALGFEVLRFAKGKNHLEAFEEIEKNGVLSILTSVFPSTTSTALPSIYTGSTPSEHGVLGYRFYTKEFGDIINPLFEKLSIDRNSRIRYDANWLIPNKTIFEYLNEANIPNYSLVKNEYLSSTFDRAVYRGSKELGYITLSDLLVHIEELLKLDIVFINAYWWSVDALSHHYGPYSSEVMNEIKMLDLFLKELMKAIDKDTMLIITADHGQIESTPNSIIDLSKMEAAKNILLPITDVRAPYLYTNGRFDKKEFESFENLLILEKDEAFKMGLFGEEEKFKERIGDFVILIKDGSTISYI
jgi:predicted AlkP superfamily pyrophosphatase or phosphodiesterase